MRKIGPGRYRCTICGAVIVTEVDGETPFDFTIARPDHPNERVVTIDGEEVHRCALGSNSPRPTH